MEVAPSATPHHPVKDSYSVIDIANNPRYLNPSTLIQANTFYIVLNLIRDAEEGQKAYESLKNAANRFLNLELLHLGAISDDRSVKEAVRQQMPFIQKAPECHAAKAIMVLAKRLEGLGVS